ncbi:MULTISPECIES: DUF1403 family protein [unclassified Mesorhizobium]|uniref:DUF1403 family protein n=1 Tax=unclassified Mesorhizobium TaxID=325217 RepID=UPI00112AF608|nr:MULTISPECIES: DUF1403 family protein [unclassified Mesorhizobium]TPK43471.1 DUF1403 family protein [Mesorhizobium sp. B2-5-2]TPL16564.1 DUF1403 family protein [Mesorhizobium sp. B2-4-7]TPL39000.1 DUF1403 family protein [Mesorhizobium sp. B2-4-5]TPM70130.1 DUF1403 family protein [Mesorhizobium sp. B2-1-6]TPN75611.1 DUF1403 family protein [Mesorhizobium sp. B1-1-2]
MGHTGQPLDQSFRLCSFPVRKGHRSQSATGALRSCSFTRPRLRLNGGAGLDGLVRQAGAELTAIGSAAGSMRLAGCAEDALRDPWYLRPAGADPGPAGAVLGAWRQLSVQPPAGSADRLEKIVDQLGLHCHRAALADLCTEIEKLAGSQRPVPFAATAIAARVAAIRPDPELLAWWLADLVLAAPAHPGGCRFL